MSRKVTLELTVKVSVVVDEGVPISDVTSNLHCQVAVDDDCRFATVADTEAEITGHTVLDSR